MNEKRRHNADPSLYIWYRFSGLVRSVYYGAGFAHGPGIPVIFLCRQDLIEEIHFDTRQYKHIEWEKERPSELREELANRIAAVTGDGPNKNGV